VDAGRAARISPGRMSWIYSRTVFEILGANTKPQRGV